MLFQYIAIMDNLSCFEPEWASSVLNWKNLPLHYSDVIMSPMDSQNTSLTIVYSTVYSDQRKHQSTASLAFVSEIHQWPVNSPQKGPVTRRMFPFDDVIMNIMELLSQKEIRTTRIVGHDDVISNWYKHSNTGSRVFETLLVRIRRLMRYWISPLIPSFYNLAGVSAVVPWRQMSKFRIQ